MTKFTKSIAALGFAASMVAAPAMAATVIWDFNLPATAVASQSPPYPTVATLTLVDTVDGVRFTLDPNEDHPGYESNSTVDALNIAYQGVDLPSSNYVPVSGPVANADTFGNANDPYVAIVKPPNNALNLDSSYMVPGVDGNGQLLLTWNNPDFNVTDTSVWTITGTTIADNFSLLATSNSNPSPSFGIFSVSPISAFDEFVPPVPSNWVTGARPPAEIPVPPAVWLFGSGLLGLVGIARRRRTV